MFDHAPQYIGHYNNYTSAWRSIQLMDGDAQNDSRGTITLEQALDATGMFDPQTGDLIGPDHPSLEKYKVAESAGKNGRHSFWYKAADGSTKACK